MHDLSVSLFGSPEIKRGKQELIIQRRKDLALLVYLLVTSQPHHRDSLANLLWEEQDQAEARSNIRKSLSRLKSIIGENVLLTSQDKVWINPNYPIDLDIAQFNLRLQQVQNHGHGRNDAGNAPCPDCEKALEEASSYYRADFLAGFSVPDSSVFEEWQFFQSESLRTNLAEVLEQLTSLHANRNEHDKAIDYCRRWLALDRLNESAQRELILLYASSGQRAAAIRQFEECRRLLKEELDAEPEEETLQLFNSIQRKRPPRPRGTGDKVVDTAPSVASTRGHHLPVHPAPFIGREREMREIINILRESPFRLVTLLGPGGSGKTRLALQVGAGLGQDVDSPFQDEIWFVPLAPLNEPKSILSAIAQSLGMTRNVSATDAHDAFLGELRGRELLLLLDNFEHLLNADSIQLITDILSASPRIRIVVTSRERLNVEGEYVFSVGGLDVPADETLPSSAGKKSDFTKFSALQLFEQCAARVQPGFRIGEENYDAVVDICAAVQGMPLAIELAASWIEIYSPPEIHNEIVRSLDFLQSDWRDLPDRQRSLRAVFDSSWKLLDKTTRPVIKALSVFRSSFTREAAQAISGASAKTLLDLTHKSWIQRLSNGRFQIHELLRQFAFEKLENEKTTFALVMKQYSAYYAAYAAGLWEDMKGVNQQRAFAGMEVEFDNIHAAWSWLVSSREMEIAMRDILPVLFHYAELRGKSLTLLHMLDTALESFSVPHSRQGAQSSRHEIILRCAKGCFFQDGYPLRYSLYDGIFPIDKASIRRAWTLAQKEQEVHTLGFWGILLCFIYGRIIKYDGGVRQLKRLLPFFERTGEDWELANGYLHLLKLMIPNEQHSADRQEQFTRQLSRAREIFASLGDTINIGQIMNLWGDLTYQQRDLEGAIQHWQLAYSSFLNAGEWLGATHMLWQVCGVYMQVGEYVRAFEGFREISITYREHGMRIEQVSALSKESFEKVRYGDIEEAQQLRLECLEIIQETGPSYQMAWNYWEMGELLRVKGDSAAAAEWYERAYQIFDEQEDNIGRSYYFRGLGDIAIAARNYEAARALFSTSADLAKTTNHTWIISYSLSKLARTQMELGDVKSARRNLHSGLQYSLKTLDKGIMLAALLEYAQFCSQLGRHGKAVVLCSLVGDHFATWHETRQHAGMLLDTLRNQVSADKYAQYRSKGCDMDLWACVKTSIKELETTRSISLPGTR